MKVMYGVALLLMVLMIILAGAAFIGIPVLIIFYDPLARILVELVDKFTESVK